MKNKYFAQQKIYEQVQIEKPVEISSGKGAKKNSKRKKSNKFNKLTKKSS